MWKVSAPEGAAGPDRHRQSFFRMCTRLEHDDHQEEREGVSEIDAPCPSFAARMAIS